MKRMALNRDWKFKYGMGTPGMKESRDWLPIDLPHDASIGLPRDPSAVGGASNGFYPGCNCIYEKTLAVSSDWLGKVVLLEVEGVYQNAVVTINQQLVGRQPYGYTTFHCDLTPYLKEGVNVLRIDVYNGGLPNTRWYSGSGLYRPVNLLIGEKIHVGPWDVTVDTPAASSAASTARVMTTVRNQGASGASLTVRSSILASGRVLATAEAPVTVKAGASGEVCQNIPVQLSRLWSLTDPFLHVLRTEVLQDGKRVDEMETPFGFRTISVDAVQGFRLNGESLKMKGGCVHHDCGLLGSAAYARAEERKVELLKASGFNAVRCAHNPPSPAFLEACDRLGMLVIDEAFDCFRHGKNPGDYSLWFEEWWQRDLAAMIRRDRNHPSIVMWSTGNEIPERNGCSDGAGWSRRLADYARSLDSTRPVTNALCDVWDDPAPSGETPDEKLERWARVTGDFAAPLDVVGYNYLLHRYEPDSRRFPGRIICGTETFPKDAFDYWVGTERFSHVIGDFVWTSLDYLGEAGIGHTAPGETTHGLRPFPWHHANCGDLDICGTKRPQSYYRDCVWGVAQAPYLAVHDPVHHGKLMAVSQWGWPDVVSSWNWPGQEGKPSMVDVYAADDEVVLLLNGREIGRKPAGKTHRYLASFEVEYRPGRLEAVGLRNGIERARTVLETAGKPVALRLSADRTELSKGICDLAFITVEVVDEKGIRVPTATNRLFFAACGAGKVLAVGNGDPASEESFTGNIRQVWRGLATAVVQATAEAEEILLTVSGEGLRPASIQLR
jgi:beta-galactosidase